MVTTINEICQVLTDKLKGQNKPWYLPGAVEDILEKEDARIYSDYTSNRNIVELRYAIGEVKDGKIKKSSRDAHIGSVVLHCKKGKDRHFVVDSFQPGDKLFADNSIQENVKAWRAGIEAEDAKQKEKGAKFLALLKTYGFYSLEAYAEFLTVNANAEQIDELSRLLRDGKWRA